MSLFEQPEEPEESFDTRPLADRMRPRSLDEYLGQDHVLGDGQALRDAVLAGATGSILLWGPPGTGKTTLAHLIAAHSELFFEPFSAVLSGVKDVRAAVERADLRRRTEGRGTLLFVDEIHRFNKAQQDAFLPLVESGQIVLVGATTENPSFSVIDALLSRCRLVRLESLSADAVAEVVRRALADAERGLGKMRLEISEAACAALSTFVDGDARKALTVLEAAAGVVARAARFEIESEDIAQAAQQRALRHDKSGDAHYDLLSAVHKSLRNSDVQASLYWFARFLQAGGDPMQMARRMLAMAAEDIGLADPMALQVATSALQAFHALGLPEGRLPLTQAVIYLATAPKSRAVATAIDAATRAVESGPQESVPMHLRNAPTKVLKEMGAGVDYRFAPDEPGHVAQMDCLPEAMRRASFYSPGQWGFEQKVRERMDDIADRRGRTS